MDLQSGICNIDNLSSQYVFLKSWRLYTHLIREAPAKSIDIASPRAGTSLTITIGYRLLTKTESIAWR